MNRRVRPKALLALCLCQLIAITRLDAATHHAATLSELRSAIGSASPGDRIVVANGTYENNGTLSITCSGTAGNPITIEAETVADVVFTGSGKINFESSVSHVVLKGFVFNGTINIDTSYGTKFLRITRNVFELQSSGDLLDWIFLRGDDIEIDHNEFRNKLDGGAIVDVANNDDDEVCQRIWIHHNYFHDQASGAGDEVILLGRSGLWNSVGDALVEHNLFVRINGEYELISNKSTGNTYRYNTFLDSTSALTFRHGNEATVYGNYFIRTRGIRFMGDRNQVFSNYFEEDEGIRIYAGYGDNVEGGDFFYRERPNDGVIAYNTFVNCDAPIWMNDGSGPGPMDTTFANNVVLGATTLARFDSPSLYHNGVWTGNIAWDFTGAGEMPSSGYEEVNPQLIQDADGVYRLQSGSPAINAGLGSYPFVAVDIDGQARIGTPDAGADEYSGALVTAKLLTPVDVGPFAVTEPVLSNAYGTRRQEAEGYTQQSGIVIEPGSDEDLGDEIALLNDGDWVSYADINFGSDAEATIPFYARVSSLHQGGAIEIRLDSLGSDPVGEVAVGANGGWDTYGTFQTTITGISGVRTVYLTFKGGSGYLFNLNWFSWTPPSEEPLGFWPMDEPAGADVGDWSGNGYDGIVGGGVWVPAPDGGHALDFDGTDTSVSLPPYLFDSVGNEVTISFWAYGGASLPANNCVLRTEDGSGNRMLSIHLPWSNGSVYWDAGDGSGYDRINRAASSDEISGAWNHWVFTKDATAGTMDIYLNGELWHSGSGMTRRVGICTEARLGSGIGTLHYDGMIDDVQVYNVALLPGDVSQLYHARWQALSSDLPVTDGLLLHLDASRITGVGVGGPIETWWNLATPGAVGATAESEGVMPTFHPDALNGKAVARFDGADDWLEIGDLRTNEGAIDVFVVAQSVDTGDGAYQRVMSAYNGSDNDFKAPNWVIWRPADSGSPLVVEPAILRKSNTDRHLQRLKLATSGGSGANQEYGGDIAEVVVFGSILTDWERNEVGYHLAHKYGLNIGSYVNATADSDNDGHSDLDELIAGTNGNDPGDYFSTDFGMEGGEVEVRWSSVNGRGYVIKRSFDLINWDDLETFAGDDLDKLFTDPTTNPAAFYMMEIIHP